MRLLPALVFLLACTAASAQQKELRRLDGSTITTADADAFARRVLTENHVTGAQIAVVQNGRLAWSFAYGLAGKDPDRPMLRDTNAWAGSITKALFATYVMSLVEREQFDLDKPVMQQLPKPLTAYPRYDDIATEVVKDPGWPLVTPRMLLDHTAGFANIFLFEPDHKLHLHFKPGTRYSYSTDGINLLQLVVEQKMGKPLEPLMQEAVFRPLHMNRSGLVYREDFSPNVADRFGADGQFLSRTRRPDARAGGSMASTADDVALFLTALLDDKIITRKTRQQMLTPQVKIPFAHQFQFGDRLLAESDETKSVGLAYGLGWGLLTRTKYGPAFFKEGHGDGAQTYTICFEKSKDCMVIFTNSDNGELAFRPLLQHILGDTVTPWEWECYTDSCIAESRRNQ